MWEDLAFDVEEELCMELVKDSIHPEEVMRVATAEALSAALELHKSYSPAVLYQLLELYDVKLYVRTISMPFPSQFQAEQEIDDVSSSCCSSNMSF